MLSPAHFFSICFSDAGQIKFVKHISKIMINFMPIYFLSSGQIEPMEVSTLKIENHVFYTTRMCPVEKTG